MLHPIDSFSERAKEVHQKLPDDVNLHLARSCFAVLLQNAHAEALAAGVSHHTFRDDVKDAIDQLEIPAFTEVDPRSHLPGKRQPSLVESLDATIDRYIVIDELKDIFSSSADSMAYGGSMKYGPFMNVRSGADASDIDAIVFTEGRVLDELDWRGIMETDLFDESDKITFFARCSLQKALVEDNLADIMSQRFTVRDHGYTISAHFIPTDFMEKAYPHSLEDITTKKTHHKYLRDYKERPFERTHVSNYDLSGTLYDIPIYNTPTDGGFIVANPAHSVINRRYVPGMYQNLVLPTASFVFGHNSQSREYLDGFSAAIVRQEDRDKHIDAEASILNSEPRKPIIPLDVSDILDS